MKCSSRRNCNVGGLPCPPDDLSASMKCSSRRNCNSMRSARGIAAGGACLNEVQLPKELQPLFFLMADDVKQPQ